MKTLSLLSVLLVTIFVISCSGEQSQSSPTTLAPTDFAGKLRALPTAPLIDVRTPGEYAGGHLQNALNIDWNGDSFDQQISALDKSKPVLVYCRSGSRSAAAASRMRSAGFKEVYELLGGIMKWSSAGLPVTTAPPAARPPVKAK
jgi:thioredoxin 1